MYIIYYMVCIYLYATTILPFSGYTKTCSAPVFSFVLFFNFHVRSVYMCVFICAFACLCVCELLCVFLRAFEHFFLIFTVKIIQIFRRVWSVAKRAAVLWSVAKCIVAVYGQRRRWRLCGQEFDTAMIYSQSLGGQCEELRRRMNT